MATDLERLQSTKSNYIRRLEEDSENPKPDYSINGQSVSRDAWRKTLTSMIKEMNELIATEESVGEGPFQVTSVGCA